MLELVSLAILIRDISKWVLHPSPVRLALHVYSIKLGDTDECRKVLTCGRDLLHGYTASIFLFAHGGSLALADIREGHLIVGQDKLIDVLLCWFPEKSVHVVLIRQVSPEVKLNRLVLCCGSSLRKELLSQFLGLLTA